MIEQQNKNWLTKRTEENETRESVKKTFYEAIDSRYPEYNDQFASIRRLYDLISSIAPTDWIKPITKMDIFQAAFSSISRAALISNFPHTSSHVQHTASPLRGFAACVFLVFPIVPTVINVCITSNYGDIWRASNLRWVWRVAIQQKRRRRNEGSNRNMRPRSREATEREYLDEKIATLPCVTLVTA